LVSALAAWYKQACASSASIVHKNIRENVLTNHCLLRLDNYIVSNGWIIRFKRRRYTAYRTPTCESRSVDSKTADD
jgi:hypothetical protein